MASRRRAPAATSFITILAIGALAFAIVAIAVTLTASAAQRISEAERDRAAVDLLEQRLSVANLIAAEQAATVLDQINGADSMMAEPLTSQRVTATENAIDRVSDLQDRADSVGSESQRWLVAMRSATDPAAVTDPYDRLVAYETAIEGACCAGIVPSDPHHTDMVGGLEQAAAIPRSVWQYFFIDVERASHHGPGIPPVVSQFMGYLQIPALVTTEEPLPSNALSVGLGELAALGVPQEAIASLRTSVPMRTLDEAVLNATGRSSIVVTTDEAYAAADATQRSLSELVTGAIESTRLELANRIEVSKQIRLLTTVLAPLLLAMLAIFGFIAFRFERNRRDAADREQALLDARNRFMRMVSHELRTPATAISGFAEMLNADWTALTDAEINEFLAIIDRQSTHLSLIVDDLLTLSHLETGRLRLHLGTVNLKQAAHDAISLVDDRYGIEVETTIDPSLTLLADPERLVQVLRNLVENAAKYGKVGVGVSAAVVGRNCEIVVSDTGAGIPPEMATRIFKFWDRGEKDGSRIRGYGMGLAIARHLARAMVGDLIYRPHHPVGNEFVLSLPLGPPDLNRGATRATAASRV